MRVGRGNSHAMLVVETDEIYCLMDPVMVTPFASNTVYFEPELELDVDDARERCNLLVISHEHLDHFDIQTLARFDRETLVLYPQGAKNIETALARLGFEQRDTLVANTQKVTVGDLDLYATSSAVPHPEVGIVFAHAGTTCWNT